MILRLLVALPLLFVGAVVQAQEQDPVQTEIAAEAETAPDRAIEEVIVTATKRSQALRDIPMSITAFSGEELEDQGAGELEDYISMAPGVSQNKFAAGANQVTVRGVGVEAVNAGIGGQQTVGYLINDVPFNDPIASQVTPDLSPFDLKSVEILKGPQGTLYGASSLNGALRYVVQSAQPEEYEVKVAGTRLSIEEGDTAYNYAVAVNVPIPLIDGMAVRGAHIERTRPGYMDDKRFNVEDANVAELSESRGAFYWQPINRLTLQVNYLTQDKHSVGGLGTGEAGEGLEYDFTVIHPDDYFGIYWVDLLIGRLDYEFGFANFVLQVSDLGKGQHANLDLTHYFVNPPDGIDPILLPVYQDVEGQIYEARLSSVKSDRFNWIVGLFLQDYKEYSWAKLNTQTLNSDNIPLPPPLDVDLVDSTRWSDAREMAAFGEATWSPWSFLHLTGGLRYYQTEVLQEVYNTGLLLVPAGQIPPTIDGHFFLNTEEKGFSPKAAFKLDISEEVSFFGNAARGFRYGGSNIVVIATSDIPREFKSDELWSYEAGIRTDWFDKTLRLDGTVFYIDWQDPQLTTADADTGLIYRTNASAAESLGFEALLVWLTPIDGLDLSVAYTNIDAVITESYVNENGITIEEGTRLPGSPDHQWAAQVRYMKDLWGYAQGSLTLNYTSVSEVFADVLHNSEIPGYERFDLFAMIRNDEILGSPAFTLGVDNLFDERYYTTLLNASGGAPEPFVEVAYRPRSIRAQVSLNFAF